MVNKTEAPYLTITVTANEVYHIKYSRGTSTDIYNDTDDNILISHKNEFTGDEHLTISSGSGYNGFGVKNTYDVYVKSKSGGEISLVRKDW